MKIDDYFRFEAMPRRIEDLETPVPIIDIDIADHNLRRWQERCRSAGLANRPHIKTHKLVPMARYQEALGASGITVQKLGEAEVMADAGLSDMLLTFNVVGRHKLERLAALARRTAISVVADDPALVEGLSWAGGEAGRPISVLVECDTGAGRNGVQTPAATADLAAMIDGAAGLSFGGLMTYPKTGRRLQARSFFEETKATLDRLGLPAAVVSSGGSPEMWSDEGLEPVTEYRAGTYVYFDRALAERKTCDYGDCALTVLATVVSRPTGERAIVDAGSKALTSDLLGLSGYGIVQDLGKARIYDVNEEHGYLDLKDAPRQPRIGETVRITPNHVCPVTNLYDKVVFVRGEEVLGAVPVDARGKVQ
jgi:D-serine deaminase-like pyridoxal phosphate-dependent protein